MRHVAIPIAKQVTILRLILVGGRIANLVAIASLVLGRRGVPRQRDARDKRYQASRPDDEASP